MLKSTQNISSTLVFFLADTKVGAVRSPDTRQQLGLVVGTWLHSRHVVVLVTTDDQGQLCRLLAYFSGQDFTPGSASEALTRRRTPGYPG